MYDDQLGSAIEQLTRKELLLQQARAKGLSLSRASCLNYLHRLGFVLANAGIDQSNIDHPDGETLERPAVERRRRLR